jgi:hypothetical protein
MTKLSALVIREKGYENRITMFEKISLSKKTVVLIALLASLINAVAILLGPVIGAVVGLFVGIVEIQWFYNRYTNWNKGFLVLATMVNSVATFLSLSSYCLLSTYNIACQKNPLVLSIVPGFLLFMVWFPLTLFQLITLARNSGK